MKTIKGYTDFINEGKHFIKLEDAEKEEKLAPGATDTIYKITGKEGDNTISEELKPYLGKFVTIYSATTQDNYSSAEKLRVWTVGTNAYIPTEEYIDIPNAAGGDLQYLEAVAVVGSTDNPKKIKNEDGAYIENPNYDKNKVQAFKVIKTY